MSSTVDVIEWHHEVPRSIVKQAVTGLLLMIFALGGFAVWAFTAPLAAAVISQGSFVATGRNKIVQHLEGGIIAAILVSEGDQVEQGQPLIQLNQTAARADLRELELRKARLEAAEARVRAQYEGGEQLVFPETLLSFGQANPEVGQILEDQLLTFVSRQGQQRDELAILENGIGSLQVRRAGYESQLEVYHAREESLLEELSDKQSLLDTGLIRRPEFNAAHRSVLETQGHIARLEAEIQEIERSEMKFGLEIQKLESSRRSEALDELQVIQSELDSVGEQARKARYILERAAVTAPVSGTVVRLHYYSAGGVIETGKPIAEILPSDAPLLIETLIPQTDIDSVELGQNATVRLSGLNQRTTPVLEGRVSYISADSVQDTSTGVNRDVYVAHVDLPPIEYGQVADFTPLPGMPAEIMIQTAERTFFDYLAKPIRDSMSRAFKEQ